MPGRDQVRLAFVGQGTYFEGCVLQDPADGLLPRFFDLRPSAPAAPLAAALRAFDPHVLIAFRPELVPPGAVDGLDRAVRVGWLTEPLPRGPQELAHPDLLTRLGVLRDADLSGWDRIVCFDPTIVPAARAAGAEVWRSVPLPVSDRAFAPVRAAGSPPRLLFVGRSTPHRETFLGPLKHDFDVLHLAHGATGRRLADLLAEADVAINLHNEPYPTFENRVQGSLAAGLLVLSEPLSPRFGLVSGVHLLEAWTPGEMWELTRALEATPEAFTTVRVQGRAAAEAFRASRVYPRLVEELLSGPTSRS